ncbi:MAG TPA: metalloregulator ArsR/SmtB family transcription factor [Nocardioidaceae bacterium]|jgi:DNA-binding transcriptional ArsR family regulator|nr:metalloregulator ArsR/SmtB family transcription factor [Nocardioidaceae bacterium]
MELSSITPAPEALRALSHPMRLRILGVLRMEGPATASGLAALLGESSGTTSYHLRQLHQHGFVVDDRTRGNGRERWWRAAHQATRTGDDLDDSAAGREAADAFGQAVAVVHTEALQQATEQRALLSPDWRAASTLSDWALRLTPARARELTAALAAVVEGWTEDEADAGASEFLVQVHAFPRPGVR